MHLHHPLSLGEIERSETHRVVLQQGQDTTAADQDISQRRWDALLGALIRRFYAVIY